MKMNKKGALPLILGLPPVVIALIVVATLIILNTVGFAVLMAKISEDPVLGYTMLGVLIIVLLKMFRRRPVARVPVRVRQ